MNIQGIAIKGISATIPQQKQDNKELDWLDGTQKQKFIATTGIRFRRVSAGETAADLCVHAAEKLIQNLNWAKADIQVLIFISQTPDYLIPGTASQIHHRLSLNSNCIALDVNQGCAGYVYGLSVIGSMMNAMGLKRGLLLVGDTISNYISKENKTIKPIFSDAGTATAIEADHGSNMQFAFGVDGNRFKTIHLPKAENDRVSDLEMNGHDVFSYGLKEVTTGLNQLISEQGGPSQLDYLVMHQANKLLNDAIAKKLGVPAKKAPSSHYAYGNTSSATIPLTIAASLDSDTFATPKKVVLAGFGVGLTWAAVHTICEKIICLPIHEFEY